MPPDPAGGPDPDPGPGLARAAPPDAARERFFCGRHEGAPVPAERRRGMRQETPKRPRHGRRTEMIKRQKIDHREVRLLPTFSFLYMLFPVPGTEWVMVNGRNELVICFSLGREI